MELGLRSNFTDWIPAVVDNVSIELALVLDRKDRLAGLANAINSSPLFLRSRASRRSRVTKPVLWVKMRSNAAESAALRWGVGSRV